MTTDANFKNQEVFFQLISSISSGSDYTYNSPIIFTTLSQRNKEYTVDFLSSLYEIFTKDEYPPTSKFYSLYILLKATEANNDFLMSYLSKQKEILTYLFKKVQLDYKKPIKDRGLAFFSKTPSKEYSIMGHNFVVMLLEAFQYWYVAYGSTDPNSALHIYQTMFNSLSKQMSFPESFLYIGKNYQVTDNFHLKPAESFAGVGENLSFGKNDGNLESNRRLEDQKSPQKPMLSNITAASREKSQTSEPGDVRTISGNQYSPEKVNNEAARHLYSCIYSGRDYARGLRVIFENVAKDHVDYNQNLLEALAEVLEAEELPGTPKFYALLLLVKLSETQNKVFNTQFAKDKRLLVKLVQDAKFDYDKVSKEKGKTLFTQDPSIADAIVGKNYMTLLLEAIEFWNKTYQTAEKGTSFYRFRALYSSLAKLVQFSGSTAFIGKEANTSISENNMSFSKIDHLRHFQESSPRKAVGLAGPHVEACVASGIGYQRSLPIIVKNLNGQSREYINDYLDTLANIMEEKEGAPISKLYSLWLLVKTSERVNPVLLEAMSKHERLLNRVFQGAQFDYNKPFEEKGLRMYPGYSMIGHKYVNIALEALKFWAEAYGTEERTSSLYTFKYMYDSLKAQITFPNEYKYIGIPMETDIMLLETTRDQPSNIKANREPVQTNQNPAFKEIEDGFNKLKEAKTGLKEVLESNFSEDPEMTEFLEFLYQEVNSQWKDIQQHAEPLIGNGNPQAEKYVEQAFQEGEIVDKLNMLYERYKGNRIPYKTFREQTLGVLEGDNKAQKIPEKPTPQPIATTNPANQKPQMAIKGGPMGPRMGGGDPLGAASIEEVSVKKVKANMPPEDKSKSPQLPTIQEAKGDLQNNDMSQSHTIFSTSLVGRPGEEDRFGRAGTAEMRGSMRQVERVVDKNDRNMRESSPLMQRTTYSEFIQPMSDTKSQQVQESAKKKPTIIGAGTRPLASNTPAKNRETVQDDVLTKVKTPSNKNETEPQTWVDVPTVKSKVLEDEASTPINHLRNSPETKTYMMEQRLKWLSHYRFKAGELQDDKEEQVPQPAQIQTFRPEEIIVGGPIGSSPKLESEDRRATPAKVLEKKVVSEEPQRRSTQGHQVMRSSMVASIRTTPAKNYESELAGIERSIKTSRVKVGDLSKIENSIRNSFTRSGKTLPDFKNLHDFEEREEKDREIARLKQENSRLLRENSVLKASVRGDDSEDKIALEKMKKLLTNYENQISSLREDVSSLRSENERLTEDLSLMTEGQNTKNSTAGLLTENRQLKLQIQGLQHELGMTRKDEHPGRAGFSASKDLSSKVLGIQKPAKPLQTKTILAPSGLKDLDLSPRTGPLFEGNFSSRNTAKPKAVKGMHFMDVPEPEVEKRAGSRSPGKRSIFEPVVYEMPQPVIDFEDMSRNTTLRSPNQVMFPQAQSRQSAQEAAKRHGVYNVNGSRNLLSPQGDEIINFKPGVGSEAEFPIDFASQNKSAQEKADRFAESPYNMSQELEKANIDPYQQWEGEDQGHGDSEADLRGMISSRDHGGQKEIRGKEVNQDSSVFDRIAENMRMSSSDLLKYKIACLKNKCPLYDNNMVQVGVTSTVVHDNTGKRNLLKLVLYHGNKTNVPIDSFTASVQSAKNISKLVKPDILETHIAVGKQVKQQVVLSFKSTPFDCLVLDASFYKEHQRVQFSLYLPSVITKFMEFKYVSAEEFRERWKANTHTVLKTKQIVLDPEIVKTGYDFKKYFAYLVDLKPMDEYDFVQGKKGIKLAGIFELEMANIDYMLKINLLPGHKVVFQVACQQDKVETATFLLHTLSFLFEES